MSLEYLNLSYNALWMSNQDSAKPLAEFICSLRNLRQLDLRGCSGDGDGNLFEVLRYANLPKVEYLDLR